MFDVSEEELEEEQTLFVEERARDLLSKDIAGVFSELEKPEELLTPLYSCSLPDLISLQLKFHQLMLHEARKIALRDWEFNERGRTISRIIDEKRERACHHD